jgi:hypothetical protein
MLSFRNAFFNNLWLCRLKYSIPHHSFRIAANGLNFVALCAGKKPANIPMTVENTIASPTSHKGMTEIVEIPSISSIRLGATWFTT